MMSLRNWNSIANTINFKSNGLFKHFEHRFLFLGQEPASCLTIKTIFPRSSNFFHYYFGYIAHAFSLCEYNPSRNYLSNNLSKKHTAQSIK